MLKSLAAHFSKPSVLRRIVFAVTHLPTDLPNLWEVAVNFATSSKDPICAKDAKIIIENLHELDAKAFDTDKKLMQDLIKFQVSSKPLGIILISTIDNCPLCESKLCLRKDRPSSVVIYDDNIGSLPATHFYKTCSKSTCGCVQYYGYYVTGEKVYYSPNWETLPYFVSSRESAFSMGLLKRFNAEILIGQLSFKQCADLYNFIHNYVSLHGQSP